MKQATKNCFLLLNIIQRVFSSVSTVRNLIRNTTLGFYELQLHCVWFALRCCAAREDSVYTMATHKKSQPVQSVTPDDVLKLKAPTSGIISFYWGFNLFIFTAGFLCPISANTYQIDFQEFCIREVDTNVKLLFSAST